MSIALIAASCGSNEAAAPEFSQAPPTPTFDDATEPEQLPFVDVGDQSMAAAANTAAVKEALDVWLSDHEVDGAQIGLGFPDGSMALVLSGTDSDGSRFEVTKSFLVTSVTKTMTAAIILELVAEGRLELDAPAPEITGFPGFAHAGRMTLRQLLQHTSGLAQYQDADRWSQGREMFAVDALDLSDDLDLQWSPGSEKGYSNSGFIYLGLIAEDVTGLSFEELIQDRIVGEVGLGWTSLDTVQRPGWVGHAAGGVRSNIPDLVRWGAALFRDGQVLDDESLAQMLDVDNSFSTGLGANPVCPCGATEEGGRWFTSIGHDGGSATVQYSPADGLVIAAKFSETFWTTELSVTQVHDLFAALRSVVSSVPPPDENDTDENDTDESTDASPETETETETDE